MLSLGHTVVNKSFLKYTIYYLVNSCSLNYIIKVIVISWLNNFLFTSSLRQKIYTFGFFCYRDISIVLHIFCPSTTITFFFF